MTEQKYRAVVRTADGRQMYGTLTDIQSAREEITATFTEDHIERPVPTTDEPKTGPTVIELASRHCESTTGNHTCADDPSRSADSPYGATAYCYPCLIRNALSQQATTVEPCCDRPGDLNWHTANGGHVVPPDVEEDTPLISPSLPTREQIIDAITCGNPYSVCDFEAEIADRVLALLQKGADRG